MFCTETVFDYISASSPSQPAEANGAVITRNGTFEEHSHLQSSTFSTMLYRVHFNGIASYIQNMHTIFGSFACVYVSVQFALV